MGNLDDAAFIEHCRDELKDAAETGGKVIDLMEALKASLAKGAKVTAPSDSEGGES